MATGDDVSKEFDWRVASHVAAFGALGGAVGLVYSLTVGTPPAVEPFPWGIAAYILLGAAAAFLGVFLVAKTDLRNMSHALGFALACGISWAPIFDASSALVTTKREQKVKKEVQAQLNETKATIDALKNSDAKSATVYAERLKQQLAGLSQSAKKVDDRKLIFEFDTTLGSAADAVKAVHKTAPNVANEMLPYVAKARIEAGIRKMYDFGLAPSWKEYGEVADGRKPPGMAPFQRFELGQDRKDGKS